MKLDSIKTDFESHAALVNEFLLSCLEGHPAALYQASSHYIKTGGKRLRPFMAIKSCEILGGSVKRALPAAAAVELVHNFSLVHDDIMDNDELRHGTATVHQSFGIPLAIIAGDILFSKAFEMLSLHTRKVGISESAATEMIARLSMASIEICEGQAMDAGQASGGKFPSEAQYIEMIRKKTAALFTVSCALGALSSPNASTEDIDRLSVFGKNIGIAFQLVDDLIGIAGDPKLTGKAAGNDLREGKKTLPILLSIQKAKGGDRDKIMKVFASKDASQADISKAVAVITELGIDEKVRKEAAQYMHSALKSIYSFPDSAAKRSLNSLAEFVVGRSL